MVVLTQDQGGFDALKAEISTRTDHICFVGRLKKIAPVDKKLIKARVDQEIVCTVSTPIKLSISAVRPMGIALSLWVGLVQLMRDNLGWRGDG